MDAAIRQHDHLEKVLSEERYKEAVEFCKRVRQQGDGTALGQVPRLISHIERQEVRRIEHERNITEEVVIHRTDPEAVKRVLTDVRDLKRPEFVEMADTVEKLYRASPDHERVRIHYSELYQQGVRLVDDRFRDFAEAIRENRAAVEKTLNERLGLGEGSAREVRIAVVDSRLYTWTRDTKLDRWENSLDDQKMYWRTKADMVEVLDQVAKHLHIRGGPDVVDRYTNELINQLSRLEDAAWNRTRRYYIRQYTEGETMQLIVDTLGLSIGDIKSRVKSMGISERGRISGPQFPEIHEWRMKSVAIIESDGSLQPTRQLRFHEDARDRDRCMIVYQHFCEFGHFEFKPYRGPDGNDTCIRLELPMVIGALMEKWGVPPGDKAIYNRGLHDCIVTEPLEVKKHYLPEVISQDGCFTRGRYQITRDHVIDAGCKKEAYQKLLGHVPELSSAEIELVKTYGRPIPASLGYGPGDRIGLRMSVIQRLTESEDHLVSETAQKLQQAAMSIPNRLLDDEVHKIIEPFGIDMSIGPREVVFFKGTGRVSVVSEAHTKAKDDAIRWSLIAPPNHPRKMRLVAEFVRKHPEDVRRIKAQIEKEGLKVHPIWEDYRIE